MECQQSLLLVPRWLAVEDFARLILTGRPKISFPLKLLHCGSGLGRGGELDEAVGGVAARERVDGHVNMLAEILLV